MPAASRQAIAHHQQEFTVTKAAIKLNQKGRGAVTAWMPGPTVFSFYFPLSVLGMEIRVSVPKQVLKPSPRIWTSSAPVLLNHSQKNTLVLNTWLSLAAMLWFPSPHGMPALSFINWVPCKIAFKNKSSFRKREKKAHPKKMKQNDNFHSESKSPSTSGLPML